MTDPIEEALERFNDKFKVSGRGVLWASSINEVREWLRQELTKAYERGLEDGSQRQGD